MGLRPSDARLSPPNRARSRGATALTQRSLGNYLLVTGVYGAFTVTDGALRTLVLLHLHDRGLDPLALALLFVLYEFFGVVTNFVGGWLGARFGLKSTLLAGLLLQAAACAALAHFAGSLTILLVTVAQGVSGIAKDLTKMSSKSYVRYVAPETSSAGLVSWVSWITGSKNALKGVGYFLGGLSLATIGFERTCFAMSGAMLVAASIGAAQLVPIAPRYSVAFRTVFSRDARVNYLAAARFFLFGSRDVWFAIALPVFLASEFGWSFSSIGAVLACWIVGYGAMQAATPALAPGLRGPGQLSFWTASLTVPLLALAWCCRSGLDPLDLIALLCLFGLLFAVNSALHSYLIVSFAPHERVAQSIGFYYTANAAGRLMGTLLSGVAFQAAGMGPSGLLACVMISTVFVLAATLLAWPLRRPAVGDGPTQGSYLPKNA